MDGRFWNERLREQEPDQVRERARVERERSRERVPDLGCLVEVEGGPAPVAGPPAARVAAELGREGSPCRNSCAKQEPEAGLPTVCSARPGVSTSP
jgi:hypothetical protein